jgi:hypothetical protein
VRALKLLFGVATAVGVTALALVALTPFDGCVLPEFTLDAGVSASTGTGGSGAGPPACGATYPDPPGGQSDGGDTGTIVVAVHTINLGDNGGTPPGYDLDNTCTCIKGGGESCVGRSTNAATYCDAPGGIDDQTLLLVELIQTAIGAGSFGSVFFSQAAGEGHWSLLIEITGYNGEANDPEVQVAIYPSPGYVPSDAGVPPQWDGTDAWRISSTSLVTNDGGTGDLGLDGGTVGDGGIVARYQATGAYVSNGTLVASIPQSELIFQGGSSSVFQLELSDGVLTGKLVVHSTPLGEQWSLTNGIIAARWALTDIFDDLASYRDENGAPICTNQVAYDVAKSTICNDADILVNAAAPKSDACDALSFGLGFTADPATLGPIVDAGATPEGGCPPGESPAGDTCPSP